MGKSSMKKPAAAKREKKIKQDESVIIKKGTFSPAEFARELCGPVRLDSRHWYGALGLMVLKLWATRCI